MTVQIAALYKFFRFPDYATRRQELAQTLCGLGIKGSLLVAEEGLNGTLAGTPEAIGKALDTLRTLPGAETLEAKFSEADEMPFLRLKVRLKREIVTMGVPGTDPNDLVGTYVKPQDWDALISDPDTVLIDTRNDYEVAIGTFEGAIDPQTETFREFPDWFREFRAKLEAEGRKPKIAMFCTGGIRCEKATSFVKAEGIDDVFHLEGGILKYLETVPPEGSLWRGECFVFDERVSVCPDLSPGSHVLCHACGHPVSEAARADPAYVEGVSCPHCLDKMTESQRARFAERQKQIDLAKARGEAHVGPRPPKKAAEKPV
ncbi:rhodanese domain protein [Hyphomonas neptunium ATCC 15444]|uniref:tRNA uridine(34) hydroxylase n=2 Tax=Hyphomonas TaxID=85 RepID=Q0BYQ3_HYPNA|nr:MULTISPECIES: rhodanese-related sulfurtransferase [Hyphomonas]ABI75356.1 rhodanese domain protein [Hyphomonas neptunium ATCC 15444]KCZ91516.1 rhodanese domain-containing protein [Hyphomonas hirschiana VP5]